MRGLWSCTKFTPPIEFWDGIFGSSSTVLGEVVGTIVGAVIGMVTIGIPQLGDNRQCISCQWRLWDVPLFVEWIQWNKGSNGHVADGLVCVHNKMAEVLNDKVKWGTSCWRNAMLCCLNGSGVSTGFFKSCNKSSEVVKKGAVYMGVVGGKNVCTRNGRMVNRGNDYGMNDVGGGWKILALNRISNGQLNGK